MVALTQKRYDMALRFHLGLFIFNPFRVGALFTFNPFGVGAYLNWCCPKNRALI